VRARSHPEESALLNRSGSDSPSGEWCTALQVLGQLDSDMGYYAEAISEFSRTSELEHYATTLLLHGLRDADQISLSVRGARAD
jgi:hypothetical protein